MKERILHGWNFQRALYLSIGFFIIVESFMDKQWIGVFLGGYFVAMGLFAFGCAAGNCFGSSNSTKPENKLITSFPDVEFEEIKTK